MKKLLAIILAGVMVFSLVACGGEAEESGKPADAAEETAAKDEFSAEKYGLDLAKEETQPMSEDRATVEVLAETAKDWLGGATLFSYSPDSDKKTYDEFVEHIGCEPSEYRYDAKNNHRYFTWYASDDDTASFSAIFEEKDGEWKLYATGSTNLGIA